MMGSTGSRTIVVNASDLPPKPSHSDRRQSLTSNTSAQEDILSVEREQTALQNERDININNDMTTSTSTVRVSNDERSGSVQYNITYALNQTSPEQQTSMLLPGNESEHLADSNERESSLPTYGELYPDEEGEGFSEEVEEGEMDYSATNRPAHAHTGYSQPEDEQSTDQDRVSATGYSRSQSLPSIEPCENEDTIGMVSAQPMVTDQNNDLKQTVVNKIDDDETYMKLNKRIGRRKPTLKQKRRKKVLDNEIEDLRVIPQDYPPPRPAKTGKAEITSMDLYREPDRRAQQVKPESFETIEGLLLKLTGEFRNEVQKVRAILMWIGYHTGDVTELCFRPEKHSPMDYLKQLMSGNISYAELFTFLCRKANIPCVLVDGFAKSQGYDVGKESLTNLINTWTAVYVAGGWRLVFPLWALTDEADEGENAAVDMDDDGNLNEFFFLTDPGEFIFRCLPMKTDWQLLQNYYSKERFKRIPYVSSQFFDSNINLPNLQDGTIQASYGYCKLNLTLREGRDEDAKLSAELTFDRNLFEEDICPDVQLDRFVAIIHSNKNRKVNVRFPSNGVYRLKLSDSKRGWLCSFRIVCEKSTLMKNAFPEHPMLDFGPCISTLNAGFVPLTHIGGVINIHVNQDVIVLFDMTEELSIKTQLFACKNDVSHYVTHSTQDKELKITVKVPVTGEYGLVILCRYRHSNNPYVVACNYLLTTEKVNTRTRARENPAQKKARARLVFVTQKSNSPEVLQQALDTFQQLKVQSEGDVVRATEKINFLRIKQALLQSIKRKNRQMLKNSLQQAQACDKHHDELMPSIAEAEACLDGLSPPSLRHNVLSMGRLSVSEISRYKKPRPLVHDIMKATMILLGESPSDLEHWSNIQKYMKRSGRNGFLTRIKQFGICNVSMDAAETAHTLVDRYDQESAVGGGSAGVGTFYVWVTDMTERVLGMKDK